MSLDRCFESIDPDPGLDEADRRLESVDVDHRRNLLVVREPAADIVVEPIAGPLTDSDDGRSGLGQPAGELLLVQREARLDEDDVHCGSPLNHR